MLDVRRPVRPIWFLFSFQGRIGREAYWLFLAACFGLSIVMQFAVGTPTEEQAMVFWLILLWPVFAVIVKRYHDRDKSGAWAVVHFVIPPIGIIECGFLRGTSGSNRFGPDVLAENSRAGKWFYFLAAAGLFLLGFFFLSTLLLDVVTGRVKLDGAEKFWGTVIGIAAWCGAYSLLKRSLAPRLTLGGTDGPKTS